MTINTGLDRVESILRSHGEYDFEKEDGEFGAPYGANLLRHAFPDAYRVEGMGSFYIPTIGTVVVTCRTISRIRTAKGRKPRAYLFTCSCDKAWPSFLTANGTWSHTRPEYCEVHINRGTL